MVGNGGGLWAKISGSWGEPGDEGGTVQITKQQTGETASKLSAEATLTLLPAQDELWGGVVEREQVATKVGEELG